MGKAYPNPTLDAALAKIATGINQTVCSAEPANYAGISAVDLATVTLTAGDGNGDYVIADDTSGRKVTVAAQNGVSIIASGTATHIAYDDGSTLLAVTTCTSQALTSGGTVDVPSHKFAIADPT